MSGPAIETKLFKCRAPLTYEIAEKNIHIIYYFLSQPILLIITLTGVQGNSGKAEARALAPARFVLSEIPTKNSFPV